MTTETASNPTQARGVLEQFIAGAPSKIILSIPGSSYQVHLVVDAAPATPVGKRLVGTIRASARRLDKIKSGGRYVEPVMGRPRRVQGAVVAIEGGSVCVDAGVPIWLRVGETQRVDQFEVGDYVTTDVLPGATFTAA